MKTNNFNVKETVKAIFAKVKNEQLSLSRVFRALCAEAAKNEILAPVIGGAKSSERLKLWECFRDLMPFAVVIRDGKKERILCDLVPYKDLADGKTHTLIIEYYCPRIEVDVDYKGKPLDYISVTRNVPAQRVIKGADGNEYAVTLKDERGRIIKEQKTLKFMVREKSTWGYTADVEFAFSSAIEALIK